MEKGGFMPTPGRGDDAPVGRRLRADTKAALLRTTASLLGVLDVTLTPEPPESLEPTEGETTTLSAPVELAGRRLWLSVSEAGRTERFDDADRELLGALAAVGGMALANADLYAEAKQQKDNLAVITGSLGEGVCAIDTSGRVTYMSPAGARMLGWPDESARPSRTSWRAMPSKIP